MKPKLRWDTSGENLRRVRVGETISFGGRKLPESGSLVRAARRWVANVDAKPMEEWRRGYVIDGLNYVETLCDALQEREVDVPLEITPDTPKPDHEAIGEMRVVRARMEWLDEENKRLRAEVERLRWFYENMRDADRRNLQMEYEETGK